jgi:hypothetical protein
MCVGIQKITDIPNIQILFILNEVEKRKKEQKN